MMTLTFLLLSISLTQCLIGSCAFAWPSSPCLSINSSHSRIDLSKLFVVPDRIRTSEASDDDSTWIPQAIENSEDSVAKRLDALEREVKRQQVINSGEINIPFPSSMSPGETTIPVQSTSLKPVQKVLQRLGVSLAGTYVASCVLADLLVQSEWMQTWRYLWPFGLGVGYLAVALLGRLPSRWLDAKPQEYSSISHSSETNHTLDSIVWESALGRGITTILAIGLIVGGAYDAWMPVYETGPNVLTAAGIGQDAAMGLFGWTLLLQTLASLSKQKEPIRTTPWWMDPLWMEVILLAQLYKLGEGSFDEVFFN